MTKIKLAKKKKIGWYRVRQRDISRGKKIMKFKDEIRENLKNLRKKLLCWLFIIVI